MKTNITKCPVCGGSSQNLLKARESHGRYIKKSGLLFQYYHCKSCKSIFNSQKVSKQFIANYYQSSYYDDKSHGLSAFFVSLSLYMKRKLVERTSHPNAKILDVGCGNGTFLNSMPSTYKKYGVELDSLAAQTARKGGARVFTGDLLDFRSKMKFDVIVCWHVIEHIDAPHIFLNKIASLLSDEGVFLCSTPNSNSLGMKYGKQNWFHLDVPRHIVLYNKQSLANICRRSGLLVKSVMTNYWEFPLDTFWSLRKSNIKWFLFVYPFMKIIDQECITIICRKK